MADVAVKHCGGCNTDKPVTEFWASAGTYDGLQSQCKTCKREKTPPKPRSGQVLSRAKAARVLADAFPDQLAHIMMTGEPPPSGPEACEECDAGHRSGHHCRYCHGTPLQAPMVAPMIPRRGRRPQWRPL